MDSEKERLTLAGEINAMSGHANQMLDALHVPDGKGDIQFAIAFVVSDTQRLHGLGIKSREPVINKDELLGEVASHLAMLLLKLGNSDIRIAASLARQFATATHQQLEELSKDFESNPSQSPDLQ